MKHIPAIAAAILLAVCLSGCTTNEYGYTIRNHQIVYNTPP